ncbi:MAG: HD domain-containing protein [Erysipelotrichaceae bacterium]|nr:HD domain-containing protein [Erysipelotrichaceae bacterium]
MIEKTLAYLRKTFDESEVFLNHESAKNYRVEHSIRVANLGKVIAEKEGYNVENVVIACLLHDISYAYGLSEENHKDHGRLSARYVRPFLQSLNLDERRINSICGAIAIHVDDEADFEFERTAETEVAGEADNLDRFDVYRIYEILEWKQFSSMTLAQKQEYVENTIERLTRYLNVSFHSKTASEIWKQRIEFQLDFYKKLKAQLENSQNI